MAKLRDIYHYENPRFSPLRDAARRATAAYQNAARGLDTLKEWVLVEFGLVHTADAIHRLACSLAPAIHARLFGALALLQQALFLALLIFQQLLVLLPAMGMFYVADILGGSRNLLVGNIIKSQFLDARDWPFGAAASVLLTVAMAVLIMAYRASSKRIGKTDYNEVA